MNSVTSKVVIITGAAGGMGRAAAERLVSKGWSVVAVDNNAEKLSWTKGVDRLIGLTADIASEAGNTEMVGVAEAEFGGLDAVILNAAVPFGGGIEEASIEAFQRVLNVNLIGPVLGIRAALPALRRRGKGSILLTASTHGLAGDKGFWAYAASKHGVLGLMKCVAREVGWEGIRVNAICPGPTRATGFSSGIETDAAEMYAEIAHAVPLQRWGEPDEIAAAMEFLISPDASFVNGVALVVDGGALTGTGLLGPVHAPT